MPTLPFVEKTPSYDGSGLVNLVGELELRLTGSSPSAPLTDSSALPDAATYVLVLFDGLGLAQTKHEAGKIFRETLAGSLDAGFPSTTSVSLSTVATGLPPSQHGQVAHLSWYAGLGEVVNTLKWVTISGAPVTHDYAAELPRPNLWERLRTASIEPITVQPGDFAGSPLSRVLYRGARFEGVWDRHDLIDATVMLAAEPGRLIFTYVPFVDVAGHVSGQDSDEFTQAMRAAGTIWEGIIGGIPPGVAVVGTADHGLVEVAETGKILVRDQVYDGMRFAGDTRGLQMWGDPDRMQRLADTTRGRLVDAIPLLGPGITPTAAGHLGDGLLLAPRDTAIIPRGFDKRLRCYHGGLAPEEIEIPLLVG